MAATKRRKSTRKSLAAKKGARTKAANKRKRSLAAKRGAAKRRRKRTRKNPIRTAAGRTSSRVSTRRRAPALRSNPKRRRRRRTTAVAAAPRRRRRRVRKNPATKRRRSQWPRMASPAAKRRYKRRKATESFHPRKKYRKYLSKSAKSRYYGVRATKRARRTVLRGRAYGNKRVRQYLTKYKMRSNPLGSVVGVMKDAAVYVAAIYGAKFLSGAVTPMLVKQMGGGNSKHVPPLAALGVLVAGGFVVPRVGILRRHDHQIMVGLGINALDIILRTYMPADLQAQLGISPVASPADPAGTQGEVPQDASGQTAPSGFGEYVGIGAYEAELGEYVGIGAYESEMGEYVGIGAEEDLGAYAEMGDGAFLSQGIGTGIGMPRGDGMLSPVAPMAFQKRVPNRSFTKRVPDVGPGFDSADSLYGGIFGGRSI